MAARVPLSVTLSADEALRDLGTFVFVLSHLFSAGRRHSSSVADILRLIKRLEVLNTEVQGMILSPNLATELLFDVLWWCRQYLNRFVAALNSEVVEAPWGSIPFSLEPILVNLKEGRYIGPILPVSLFDLVTGRRPSGGGDPKSGGGGGGDSGN